MTTATHPAPTVSPALRLLAVPLVAAGLLIGLYVVARVIAPGYWSAIIGGVAWFLVASFALGRLTRARPELKLPVRATFLVTAAAVSFAFYWTSIRETTVDEKVVTGLPAARTPANPEPASPSAPAAPAQNVLLNTGTVESLAHSGKGKAAVVRLASGPTKLTLTDFDIDPGPQVVVRLVAGGRAEGSDYRELGDLKGTRGDQQYTIPPGTDLKRYDTVVFWCVPFTQALAKADLQPA